MADILYEHMKREGLSSSLELVTWLEEAATALVKMPPEDAEVADVIGTMDRVERLLKTTRRKWEQSIVTELPEIPVAERIRQPKRQSTRDRAPVAQSQQFELLPIKQTVRSYNFPAIVTGVQRVTDWDTLRTLLELNRADALRFEFQWTNLKKFLKQVRVPMSIQFDEVDDEDGIDGHMVGEVERDTGRFKKEPIHPDDVKFEEPEPDPVPHDDQGPMDVTPVTTVSGGDVEPIPPGVRDEIHIERNNGDG